MADLSDEEPDIDIESDEDDGGSSAGGITFLTEADKKAHHNALERKRRDHIKESFTKLRDAIPETRREKTSRALILKKATEYIRQMNQKNQTIVKEIEKMKRQNEMLKQQALSMEHSQGNNSFGLQEDEFQSNGTHEFDQSESSEVSDDNLDNSYYNQNKINDILPKRAKIKN